MRLLFGTLLLLHVMCGWPHRAQEQSAPLGQKHYHITLYDGGTSVRDWVGHDVSFAGNMVFFTDDDLNKPFVVNGTFIVEVETE